MAVPPLLLFKLAPNLNKRPMGHVAHLRNKFKLINTFEQSYDYIITLNRRGKNHYLLFKN